MYFSACACRTLVRHACVVNACVLWIPISLCSVCSFFSFSFFFFFFFFFSFLLQFFHHFLSARRGQSMEERSRIRDRFNRGPTFLYEVKKKKKKKMQSIEQDGRSQLKLPRPRTREYRVLASARVKLGSYKSSDGRATDLICYKICTAWSSLRRRTFEFEKISYSLWNNYIMQPRRLICIICVVIYL